jgi:hypothetical protein
MRFKDQLRYYIVLVRDEAHLLYEKHDVLCGRVCARQTVHLEYRGARGGYNSDVCTDVWSEQQRYPQNKVLIKWLGLEVGVVGLVVIEG